MRHLRSARYEGSAVEESGREPDAHGFEVFEAVGSDASADELPGGDTVGIESGLFEDEEVVHGNIFAFHACDFGDFHDFAGTASESCGLNDEVYGGGDLSADNPDGEIEAGHTDHHFESADGVAGIIGVQSGHAAIVTGIHSLEHIECFGAAGFADDESIGPHAECISGEVAAGDGALSFDVWRSGFHANNVRLLESEFSGVFDGGDAFVVRDVTGEHIQECSFA